MMVQWGVSPAVHQLETFSVLSDDKKNNLVQRGRCTSYSYPYLPEKAIIGGTAPPPYHSGKELSLRPPEMYQLIF